MIMLGTGEARDGERGAEDQEHSACPGRARLSQRMPSDD